MPIRNYIISFLGAFFLALILTPLMRRIAKATGKIAVPDGSRWHKKETALLGGVSIYLSSIIIWLGGAYVLGVKIRTDPFPPIILCSFLMFLIGLLDDIWKMDPQQKLAGQFIVVSLFMIAGYRLNWTISRTANTFLTIVWIVGITNAFNLLDNMDGLSAGIGVIASIFLFLNTYINHPPGHIHIYILFIISGFVGALTGFLIYNFNPASIFMGDSGSLFIGFLIGSLIVVEGGVNSFKANMGHLLSIMAIPVFIVFIPILDTCFVSIMRKLFQRPITQGGKDHSSHRMVAIGLSEKKAVLVLYAFSILSGIIAIMINYLRIGPTIVIIVLYLLMVIFFWIYLGRVKVYENESIPHKTMGLTPILVQITYRRRLFEVILDFVLISVSYYTAYLLRFEGQIGPNFKIFLKSVHIVIACQIFSFYIMGVYKGIWERTSISDLIGYIKAITLGTVLSILILLFLYRFHSFSRVVFIIYWMLLLLLVSLSRLSFRLVDEGIKKGKQKGRPVLIYGAGSGGHLVMKEIESNRALNLSLVGFIDDDPNKKKRNIQGYPVLGGLEDIEDIVRKNGIKEVIISFKNNGAQKRKELEEFLKKRDLDIKVSQLQFSIE